MLWAFQTQEMQIDPDDIRAAERQEQALTPDETQRVERAYAGHFSTDPASRRRVAEPERKR
jgi:hypothetical protein